MGMRAIGMEIAPGGTLGIENIPGILDRETLLHLLEVELARARRYEHPFSLMSVRMADAQRDLLDLFGGHPLQADPDGVCLRRSFTRDPESFP